MSGCLVAVVGPTAVGKSALALALAGPFNGEIVSADSRQVYRHMDIGTAKPSPAEQALVPHHLIDIVNPDQPFGLAGYQAMAFTAIASIQSRGRLPFLVGGTGQYVKAVLENWVIPHVEPDLALRCELEEQAERHGVEKLFEELQRLNPASASRIDPRNTRRVIRALEVSRRGGPKPGMQPPPFAALIVGLTMPRAELYQRIDTRIKAMMDAGLVDEVKRLLEMGYGPDLPAMSGIGYRQVVKYLQDEMSLPEGIESINIDSHRLVRQQYNWFKPADERIRWFDVTCGPYNAVIKSVAEFLASPEIGN